MQRHFGCAVLSSFQPGCSRPPARGCRRTRLHNKREKGNKMKKVVRNVDIAASVVLTVGVSAQEATPSAVEYTCLLQDVVLRYVTHWNAL